VLGEERWRGRMDMGSRGGGRKETENLTRRNWKSLI